MRRVNFEFAPARLSAGRRLLALGILCAAIAGFEYLTLADEAAEWDAVAAKASATVKNPAGGAGDLKSDIRQEIETARGVIRRLSLPWDALFRAMETAAFENVALLGVQPDAQQSSVNLAGEARAYADVLTYMSRLERSGALTNVRLLSHEIRRDDPQRPVAFTVAARWKTEP